MDVNFGNFPDRVSFDRVAKALWDGSEPRGAALMVGAGLSRCATRVSGDSPAAPLWTDFARAMEAQLYPNKGAPTDPLRLAQEYEAALGRTALDDLIRSKVNDEGMLPGDLHRNLVALPWTDILTTNWDTLLERAASDNPDTFYSVVKDVSDIARTRSPRIVKLHGSMPSDAPFIFTEEDFRGYPKTNAPFVNLAQQVVMESALCLLGFSGDDPNFLQWTGWVRDHLGKSAPDIFLVGALNLSPAKRKMLEGRGVRPIDFTPALAAVAPADRHSAAVSAFVEELKRAKPWPRHRWPQRPPAHTPDSKEVAKDPIGHWKNERLAYPGWVVAPYLVRSSVERETGSYWMDFRPKLNSLDKPERHRALYEFGWRVSLALAPLPKDLLRLFKEIAMDEEAVLSVSERCEVAYWLLREAREAADDAEFGVWESFLAGRSGAFGPAELVWERCLRARGELNVAELEKLLTELTGEDPIWQLRKAALLAMVGRNKDALVHARAMLRDMRVRSARDRKSIWVASRLAWSLYVCSSARWGDPEGREADRDLGNLDADRWPSALTLISCDPWEERRFIDDDLRDLIVGDRSFTGVREEFDPGHGTRYSSFLREVPITEATKARRFYDGVGVPRVIGYVNPIGDALEVAAQIDGATTYADIMRLAGSELRDDKLGPLLSRLIVARLDEAVVQRAVARLADAFVEHVERMLAFSSEEQWQKRDFWSSKGRRIAEVLSRLLVRAPASEVKRVLDVAFSIAKTKDLKNRGFYKPLSNLLARGLSALAQEDRAAYLLDAMELPVPLEKDSIDSERDWPELVFEFSDPAIDRATADKRWSKRVRDLMDIAAAPAPLPRRRAIQRLSQLNRWGVLTSEEKTKLADAVWAVRDAKDGMPRDTGLLHHVMLTMPEPEPGAANEAFRKNVLKLHETNVPSEDELRSVFNLVRHLPRPPGFALDRTTAVSWLHRLLTWKRPASKPALAEERGYFRTNNHDDALGWTLVGAVMPSVEREDITDEVLANFLDDSGALSFARAIPSVLKHRPEALEQASDLLRRRFAGANEFAWQTAGEAMVEWSSGIQTPQAPPDLFSEIASAVLSRHPKSLLSALIASTRLVGRDVFSNSDLSKIEHGLSYLLVELDYSSDSADKVSYLSVMRGAAAKLAFAMQKAGRTSAVLSEWLTSAANDPLPDVRFYREESNG